MGGGGESGGVVEFYIVERDGSSLPSSSLTMRFVKMDDGNCGVMTCDGDNGFLLW